MLCVNSNTHHQQKQQINVSKKRHKITPKIPSQCVWKHPCQRPSILQVPPPTPVNWIPSASCNLFCCAVSEMSFFQWMWPPWIQHNCCPSLRRQVPRKKGANQNSGRCPNQKGNHGNHEILPKTKKKKLSPKIPSYLSISLFLLHTPNRVSLIFFGKENTAPNIEPPPPSNPPSMSPCRSSRSHSAPSSHRKATLEPSFWNLAAYSWKRSDKFSLVPKKRWKVADKNKTGKRWGKVQVVFLKIATIYFLVKKQDAVVYGWFQKSLQ